MRRAWRSAASSPWQRSSFVAILFGFLLQWPTILTVAMFPVLLVMYARLALHEEADMRREFGTEYDAYAARTPRFVPGFSGPRAGQDRHSHA